MVSAQLSVSSETVPTSTVSNRHETRIEFVDALRGIASLMVVVFHAAYWDAWQPFVSDNIDLGQAGVALFFVVSGFVIPLSMKQGLLVFWCRRVLRLYPLYWYILTFFIGLAIVRGGSLPGETENLWRERPVLTLIANVLMFQYPFQTANLVPNSWTLTYELFFYVVMSLLVAADLHKYAAFLSVTLLCLALLMSAVGIGHNGTRWSADLIAIYLSLMFLGVVLHQAFVGERPLLLTACIVGLSILGHMLIEPVLPIAVARATGIILFLIGYALRSLPMPRLLLFLGKISYSFYLLHIVVIVCLHPILPDTSYIALPVYIGASMLVAACSERWIERPASNYGRRLMLKKQV